MKQIFYIKAEQDAEAVQKGLLVIAGLKYCSFAILNNVTNELLEFGYYIMPGEQETINALFDLHPELKEPFFYSVVAYDIPKMQFIPSEYYQYEDAKLHLETIYGFEKDEMIISEQLPEKKMFGIYRLPPGLHDELRKNLPGGKFWHLNSVQMKSNSFTEDVISIDFKPDDFSIIVFKAGKLQLTNTIPYTTPEDVVYHLLNICQQLLLPQQTTQIILSGLIEKDSAIYRELYKYFIRLEFASLGDKFKIGEVFKEHPEQYFTTISKLSQCVS